MTVGILLVGVYTEDKSLSIERDFPLTAEDVCKECASQLQIDASFIQLFGLFDIDKKIWLCPNRSFTDTDCGNDVQYVFRIRFHPDIPIKNDKFTHYLHLQYRHCFTKEFLLDKIGSSVLFGLGVLDMVTDSYKKGDTRKNNVFQSGKYKSFFPEDLLNRYHVVRQFKLLWNLKKQFWKKHKELVGQFTINELEKTYIKKIKTVFFSQITEETYRYKDKAGNEKAVAVKNRDSEFMVCFGEESYRLKLVKSVKIQNNMVEIYFSGCSPKMFQMEAGISKSFVSAMDGLYRLAYNHHYGICDDVLSPRIKMLQQLGYYDQIKEETAAVRLEKADKDGCFLVRMRANDTEGLDVFALDSEDSSVVKYTVGPNEEFESLESLQQTHTFLQHKLKPEHFEWCHLLFCHNAVSLPESSNAQLVRKNQVFLSSEIALDEEEPFHRGIFTESFRAKIKGCKTPVSITRLRDFQESYQYTQVFMEGAYSLLEMCECPCFLQVKGFTMEPSFGLVTEFPFQRVVSYLSSNHLPLRYILEMALTVAEGLEFLRKEGIVHGDISCENLILIDVNTVKITDPSIVSKVYLLPKNNAIYKSRLPWLDPQLQRNQSVPTFESDIFSYGTTLCEMLCLLCKPPNLNRCQDKYEAPCRLLFNISENEAMAENANSVRKQLLGLILKCRSHKMENRPQPQDISAQLGELIHEPINQQSLPTDSSTNGNHLCNHTWSIPPILSKDIPGPIKAIQDNSRKLKVPKSTPIYVIDMKNLEKGEKLGRGASGDVYLATYSTSTYVRPVALKIIPEEKQKMTLSEVEILHKLKHERVVDFVGFCPGLGIVLEYVSGGDLASKLKKNRHSLIRNLKNILLEITEGMEYLQMMKIIHRDLAARNILLTESDHVKITDFGLSSATDGEVYVVKTKKELPFHWCPPEQERISSKSDVWSFGIVMWECYSCGEHPSLVQKSSFLALQKSLKAGNRLARPKLCPEPMYKVMRDCWAYEPSGRPDFTSLVSFMSVS